MGSKGPEDNIFFFLDSDDFIAEFALESLYRECMDQKMPDVLLSEGEFLYSKNRITKKKSFNCVEYRGITGRNAVLKTMYITPNWGYSESVIVWTIGESMNFGLLKEDWEKIWRLLTG